MSHLLVSACTNFKASRGFWSPWNECACPAQHSFLLQSPTKFLAPVHTAIVRSPASLWLFFFCHPFASQAKSRVTYQVNSSFCHHCRCTHMKYELEYLAGKTISAFAHDQYTGKSILIYLLSLVRSRLVNICYLSVPPPALLSPCFSQPVFFDGVPSSSPSDPEALTQVLWCHRCPGAAGRTGCCLLACLLSLCLEYALLLSCH